MRFLLVLLGSLMINCSWGQSDSTNTRVLDSLKLQLTESIRLWNDLERNQYFQDSVKVQSEYEQDFIDFIKALENGDEDAFLKLDFLQNENPISMEGAQFEMTYGTKSNIISTQELAPDINALINSYSEINASKPTEPEADVDSSLYIATAELLKNFSTIISPDELIDLEQEGVDSVYNSKQEQNQLWYRGPSQFDSRIEIHQLNGATAQQINIRKNVHSVGILVEKENLQKVSESFYELNLTNKLGEVYNLCAGEAFIDQPVLGVGTAFMIKKDTFLTAFHVFERPISDYVLVFGYEMLNRAGLVEAYVRTENVYELNTMISDISDFDADFAFFTVDRKANRFPVRIGESMDMEVHEEVYCIGYPSGLPAKVSVNAGVLDNSNSSHFFTSLDVFQGNSGSPVFDATSHSVIGILVSGQLDYVSRGGCNETTLFDYRDTEGEKVIRIEQIMELLND